MSIMYDINGTTNDSFTLNNKITFLQGENSPEETLGKVGDVYFQHNGAIWTKQKTGWVNINVVAN